MQAQNSSRDRAHRAVEFSSTARWAERLIARREITESGCWEWTGSRLPRGYGVVGGSRHLGYRNVYVHRVAAIVFLGASIEGQCVCHHCDNPPCFNPEHLFVGTLSDNSRDMSEKGRAGRARSTLTDEDIRVIYMRAYAGESRASIAADFGIPDPERVSRIAHGQRFSHVTRDLPRPANGRFGAKGGVPKGSIPWNKKGDR